VLILSLCLVVVVAIAIVADVWVVVVLIIASVLWTPLLFWAVRFYACLGSGRSNVCRVQEERAHSTQWADVAVATVLSTNQWLHLFTLWTSWPCTSPAVCSSALFCILLFYYRYYCQKTSQLKTVCKDDSGCITQQKQQKSKRWYYLAAHCHIVNVQLLRCLSKSWLCETVIVRITCPDAEHAAVTDFDISVLRGWRSTVFCNAALLQHI